MSENQMVNNHYCQLQIKNGLSRNGIFSSTKSDDMMDIENRTENKITFRNKSNILHNMLLFRWSTSKNFNQGKEERVGTYTDEDCEKTSRRDRAKFSTNIFRTSDKLFKDSFCKDSDDNGKDKMIKNSDKIDELRVKFSTEKDTFCTTSDKLSKDSFCKDSEDKDKVKNSDETDELPEEPTTCCMSGCANCVWIEYAEKLNELFQGQSDKAKRIILEKVQDPNMKAFLQMELDALERKKKDGEDETS